MKSGWNNGYIFSLFIEATQVKELEFYLLEIVFHVLLMWKIAVSQKKASEGENVLFCFYLQTERERGDSAHLS